MKIEKAEMVKVKDFDAAITRVYKSINDVEESVKRNSAF